MEDPIHAKNREQKLFRPQSVVGETNPHADQGTLQYQKVADKRGLKTQKQEFERKQILSISREIFKLNGTSYNLV